MWCGILLRLSFGGSYHSDPGSILRFALLLPMPIVTIHARSAQREAAVNVHIVPLSSNADSIVSVKKRYVGAIYPV